MINQFLIQGIIFLKEKNYPKSLNEDLIEWTHFIRYGIIKCIQTSEGSICKKIGCKYQKSKTNLIITGKSFSEVPILALTNPQYDKRLSIEFTSSEPENSKLRTWGEHVVCINCSECQNKKLFVCTTCSPQVLSL